MERQTGPDLQKQAGSEHKRDGRVKEAAPDPHRLKALQTRRQKLAAQHKEMLREIAVAQKQAAAVAKELAELEAEIETLESAAEEPLVSEHAMLRYIERVMGVDLDEVRAAILDPRTAEAIKALGSGVYPGEGFRLRVRGKTIVTVLGE